MVDDDDDYDNDCDEAGNDDDFTAPLSPAAAQPAVTSAGYWTINVTSRKRTCSVAIFEIIQEIIETNILTKLHEDRTLKENVPPPGGHIFQPTGTIFELVHNIFGTHLLTKCNEDRTINAAYIIGTNLLIKFHGDRTINVGSRLLQKFYYCHIWKNAPPPDIIGTNLFKCHVDRTINEASREKCPVPSRKSLQTTGTIFELIQDIIWKHFLTKFHEDRTINVGSSVNNILLGKNTLTKFHDDQTINVDASVLTRQMLTPHDRYLT
ncbi:hypothetical protein DPMN_031967 [Dreissena polymorpha]|uniref:Uncharacterized protein n=1 Tax=Dreissena polymorpha TaxID=45954 RepID=A0A9D4RIH5_DREPO|nr:hypothetical protein DPMN_031967 [Dreissena polymorpha]